jgi:cytochrome c oxidase cbb3-type subunit III
MAASMRRFAGSVLFVTLWSLLAGVSAQPPPQFPSSSTEKSAAVGAVLCRMRCADCHGIDAKGVLGPDLTTIWAGGASDEAVFRTIRQGVSGTEMPSSTAPDAEISALVAYLRSLNTAPDGPGSGRADQAQGNAETGERLFWTRCGSCHRIDGRGGRLGPDLSRVGLRRSSAALAKKIRTTSLAAIAPGFQPVTLVMTDGARVRGARTNEDAFSIQIMDVREQLVAYPKATLKDVIDDSRSLMPEFSAERLSNADLDDLLAFLAALRRPLLGR